MEPWLIATIVIVCILCLILLGALFKLYLKLSTGWDRSATCLVGKTAIVTGSNTGIGYNTALDFAKRGARVILACRDPKRAGEARAKMVEASGNPNVVIKLLDLASLASVREFAKDINATEDRLDILVNNAGAAGFGHVITPDGLSMSMQINHFGPFLLTLLLIGLLKKSAPSRIVTVSSDIARTFAKLDVEHLNDLPNRLFFAGSTDYANTKLCNILFSNELARKLKGSGVDANAVQPGLVRTDFLRNLPGLRKKIVDSMGDIFSKTPEEGAQTSIYAAVSKDLSGVSGGYYSDCKTRRPIRATLNEALARKLWEKSEEFVKLTPEERVL